MTVGEDRELCAVGNQSKLQRLLKINSEKKKKTKCLSQVPN